MDIRLRILRRIIEIGECQKYRIKYEAAFSIAFNEPRIDLIVFSGVGDDVVMLDSYTKYGLDDEKAVFEWLDMWRERIEEERKFETNRH